MVHKRMVWLTLIIMQIRNINLLRKLNIKVLDDSLFKYL